MRSFGKLAGTSSLETSDRKGQESLDNLIRQTIGKESLLSFSRSGENPAQLIHLLHAFEQQSGNKLSKSSTIEVGMDSNDCTQEQNGDASHFLTESSSVKESIHNSPKETGSFGKSLQNPTEHVPSVKFPEAVVAIAQAAAKVNGEREKYLPGWPLLSKVQMLKCEKCSREFISPLNHRRHIRVHRRLLNLEKDDSQKKRVALAEFWDKLSADEARQILSLKNVMLEEVPGSSIVKAMTSFIHKPGLLSLPQFYVKAGAALLDVLQTKPSRFPLAATDLFSILDDASEKTFLCAGTALSVQKFVFGGGGKVSLEVRNLLASMGFLVEQKIVKAWFVDKDAEALRCQKLLVEEEEAAEKKRAERLERKRVKKLRHKELKEKEQAVNVESVDSGPSSPEVGERESLTAAVSSPSSAFSEDASPRLTPAVSCSDLYKDASTVGENGTISNADQGSPDMDLDSRASQDSVAGASVYPELDYANHQGRLQDKMYPDCKFVRSWRERKSFTETDLVLCQKHLSGSKNHQTLSKRSRKSYNGLSSWQVSSNGVSTSNSVSGQMFGHSNKPVGQRTSLGVNSYRIWTKKAHQTSMPDDDKGVKTEGGSKDNSDAAGDVKSTDTLQSSSYITYNCEGTPMSAQEDLGIIAVETNPEADLNNIVKFHVSNDPSFWSNPGITGGELLIGSMCLRLDSFPNGVAEPRLVYSKEKLQDEFNSSADGTTCNSCSNCFECVRTANAVGALHPTSTTNSCAKVDGPYDDRLSDGESLGHPLGKTGYGNIVKQAPWQDGAGKSGTKIWRPVTHVIDCNSSEGYVTDCTANGSHIEGDFMDDSQGRAAINATAHCHLKHEINVPENLRHPICTQKGHICSTDAPSEQIVDPYQSEQDCGETIERILRNEIAVHISDGAKEPYESSNCKKNGIIETINQRETKFESACDAATEFLSKRWETAVMSSEAKVFESLDSGAVEEPFCGVTFVASETGHLVSGNVSETTFIPNASFQSKGGSGSSIKAVQGRQKAFDHGFAAVPSGPSSAHNILAVDLQETGNGADPKKIDGVKPEKGHLKDMPRERK